jgi:replication factor C small subunit
MLMPVRESPWVEKYKPQTLDDVIGDPLMLSKFKEYILAKNIPHLLFAGRPGTGKSTCAKILAKEVTSEGNILYINASQEKGVDVIRNKVDAFCSMKSFGKLRVVIFDEFDGMTWQAMDTMRNTMEEYIDGSRFILTCNYEKKISEPIMSRCQMYNFTSDEKQQKVAMIRRCSSILSGEKVTSPNLKLDLIKLVNKYYPDIRRTINAMQKMTTNNVFEFKDDVDTALENNLINFLIAKDVKAIRANIVNHADYNDLYKIIFNRAGDICEAKKMNIMLIVGDAVRWHAMVLDPEINFVTCIINICKELCSE